MIRLLLVLPVLAGLAGIAAAQSVAQTVVLRSGAHDGFDRIVIPFEQQVDWRLGRRGDDYVLLLASAAQARSLTLDLSGVFARIRPDRLAALRREADGALRLQLACVCHATAFGFGPGWVVIDIADGAPPHDSRFEAELPLATGAAPPRPRARRPVSPVQPLELPQASLPALPATRPEAGRSLPPPPRLRADPLPAQAAGPALAVTVSGDSAASALADAIDARVARARADLLADLDRAAVQGLVLPGRADPAPPLSAAARGAPPQPAAPAEGLPPQLDAITAVDAARRAAPGVPKSAGDAGDCPSPDSLDIGAWAFAAPAAPQIAAARAALLAEFDRPQPEAVLRLARLYLYFGFGAEAAALLDAFPLPGPAAQPLRRIATIMDFPDGAHAAGLQPLAGCPGPAALWDLLVQPITGALGPERLQSALATFAALPDHLRRHLGPAVAVRLADAGREDAARMVLAAIDRATYAAGSGGTGRGPDPAAGSLRLTEARVADGSVGDAELARLAEGNGPEAAAALLTLGERHLARNTPLPAPLQASLAALAFELRHSAEGAALKGLELRARAARGEHAAAFAALEEVETGPVRYAPLPAGLLADLLRRLFADAGDAAFAETYFRHRARIEAAPLDRDLRRQGARRLLAAGFAQAAWSLLHPPGSAAEPEAQEDRLLAAEILMAQGAVELALQRMAGLEGSRAAALRLRLAMLGGDTAAAQAEARSLGEPELVSRADWHAGDWSRLRDTGPESVRRTLALEPGLPGAGDRGEAGPPRAEGGPTPPGTAAPRDDPGQRGPDAAEPSLTAAREELARSRALREALDALLADFPPPEG